MGRLMGRWDISFGENCSLFLFWKFNLFSQVSSEEEQEKPGNFIQGKPRMSLVGTNLLLKSNFFRFTLNVEFDFIHFE